MPAVTLQTDPDGNGALDSIGIISDWNPHDGVPDDPYENIRFTVAGNTLFKQEPTDLAPVRVRRQRQRPDLRLLQPGRRRRAQPARGDPGPARLRDHDHHDATRRRAARDRAVLVGFHQETRMSRRPAPHDAVDARRPSERGAALVFALFGLATLTVLGLGLTSMGMMATKMTSNERDTQQAIALADAGLAHARKLITFQEWDSPNMTPFLIGGDAVACNGDELSQAPPVAALPAGYPTLFIQSAATGGQAFGAGSYRVYVCDDHLTDRGPGHEHARCQPERRRQQAHPRPVGRHHRQRRHGVGGAGVRGQHGAGAAGERAPVRARRRRCDRVGRHHPRQRHDGHRRQQRLRRAVLQLGAADHGRHSGGRRRVRRGR